METNRTANIENVWRGLSENAQRLAITLAVTGGSSQKLAYLEFMSQEPGEKFNLKRGITELGKASFIQEITLIEEKREQLAAMPIPREIFLIPGIEVPIEQIKELINGPTLEESRYLHLLSDIREYEEGREKDPKRFKSWDEPRYRLASEMQRFLVNKFEKRLGPFTLI